METSFRGRTRAYRLKLAPCLEPIVNPDTFPGSMKKCQKNRRRRGCRGRGGSSRIDFLSGRAVGGGVMMDKTRLRGKGSCLARGCQKVLWLRRLTKENPSTRCWSLIGHYSRLAKEWLTLWNWKEEWNLDWEPKANHQKRDRIRGDRLDYEGCACSLMAPVIVKLLAIS